MTINLKVPDLTELKPRITVFGVGGAGGNAVNNMISAGVQGVEFVVANTDAQALTSSAAERRIQMGANVTEGLGAGSKPEVGAAAAEEAMADIKAHLTGSHMVFITAGMGGGTGTGAAPVIARASREEGILTVGVVTKPFQFEGTRRLRSAEAGIGELEQYVDTLLVIPNQNLFRIANERTTFSDAFAMADDVLRSGVSCITDLMVKEGLINLDFADVRTIMAGMGKAMMGTGESTGERRAIDAAEQAISNPLLDDVSIKGASGLLVSITGGNDLTLYEVDEAASRIRAEADDEANIIVGATFDDVLDGRIRVSVVATGLGNIVLEEIIDAPQTAAPDQAGKQSLTERLAGLSSAPVGLGAAERRMPPRPQKEESSEAPVWQAPGNVTIERRPAAAAKPSQPAAERPQATGPKKFVPGAPVTGPRPVRRMPNVEELPVTAQNEIRAQSGQQPPMGLDAHKRKVGFLERLAGVGRTRKEEPQPEPAKQEPDFPKANFAKPGQGKPEAAAKPEAGRAPRPAQAKPVKFDPNRQNSGGEPRSEARSEMRGKSLPMSRKASRPMPLKAATEPAEQGESDDLSIPAFLRRQAN